jgi:hypothetical protein
MTRKYITIVGGNFDTPEVLGPFRYEKTRQRRATEIFNDNVSDVSFWVLTLDVPKRGKPSLSYFCPGEDAI